MRLSFFLGLLVMLAASATFAAQAGKKPTAAQPTARRPAADAVDEDTADADTDADGEAAKKSDEDAADDANAGKAKPKPASGKPGKKPLGLKLAGDDEAEAAELEEKFSYMQGYGMGQELAMRLQQLQQVDLKFNRKAFDQALTDALEKKAPDMSEEDMQAAIEAIQKRMQQARATAATENKKAEEKFLAANKKKEGVKSLPGGLQYKVIKSGKGKSPKATDTVSVDYTGTLLDGSKFDSSVDRGEPITMRVDQFIPGWKQALPLMKVGDKWMLYVPSSLAYGQQGNQVIPPNSMLQFELELLEVNPKVTKPGPR